MCAAKNNKNKRPSGLGNLDFSGSNPITAGSDSVVDRIAKGIGSVLGSDISKGIIEDKPLIGTCGVCGTPINPLMTGVPVETRTCKVCHQKVCAKHFSRSKQICSKCSTGNDSWCKTPLEL